ncbi:ASCH domain-containing protein [Jeotgalibaca sp. MA1X17-3]|uniref:ASCH domain-containing protein n=1 Tax=Jeotgalibaca sp. MA1X17-3 TaxID=2908211 RepID=UPI001F1E6DF0|nr:ASCH domain-containing protein [Jeotgalibaca sp. MA1X17-3]UJF15913.1 ASCH domain-containing protein [Jeotgalibaca sp. MA1X17-3]
MIHQMGLYGEYFHAIKIGKKTIEVRLNDEKRRKIKVGDFIELLKVPQKDEILKVQVIDLKKYNTFEAMYNDISFKYFDCEGWTMKEMVEETYKIYSPKQEKKWGALAITIAY